MDIVEAEKQVTALKTRIKLMSENVPQFHKSWYKEAEELAKSVDVSPCIPSRCGFQTHRNNTPADNAEEYWLRVVTVPLLGK